MLGWASLACCDQLGPSQFPSPFPPCFPFLKPLAPTAHLSSMWNSSLVLSNSVIQQKITPFVVRFIFLQVSSLRPQHGAQTGPLQCQGGWVERTQQASVDKDSAGIMLGWSFRKLGLQLMRFWLLALPKQITRVWSYWEINRMVIAANQDIRKADLCSTDWKASNSWHFYRAIYLFNF